MPPDYVARALGAAGVGIGQPGVEAVIDILNTELTNIMRQAGTPTLASITSGCVQRR